MLELLVSDYRPLLQDVLTYSIFVAALIFGGGPERATIGMWMLFFEFPKFVYKSVWGGSFQFQSMDMFLASSDLFVGFAWIWIALHANRNYPMLIAGLQLLAIAAHVARGALEVISPLAYAIMFIAPGWIQLVVMAIGIARHAKRENRFGPYRDWRIDIPWLHWLSAKIRRV